MPAVSIGSMSWNKCLAYGQEAEHALCEWMGGEPLPPYHPQGDFLWHGLGVEVKREQRFTGNFFIENMSSATRKGWIHTLKCDLLCYMFPNKTYWMPFARLQAYVLAGKWREVTQKRYNQTNQTSGWLVPIDDVCTAIAVGESDGCGYPSLCRAVHYVRMDSGRDYPTELLCPGRWKPL